MHSANTGTPSAPSPYFRGPFVGLFKVLFAAILLAFLFAPSVAAKDRINSSLFGSVAIDGYDPVAYFNDGRATKGERAHTFEWMGANWRFANSENREAFAADPERYAPQYGGYCAWAVSQGYTADIDPEAWTLVDGKLYLNYNKDIREKWRADQKNLIEKANRNWPSVLDE